MHSPHSFRFPGRAIALGLLSACSATSSLTAAVTFQANFDDATHLVSSGGTGVLNSSSYYTRSITDVPALAGGNFLKIVNPQTATGGLSSAVTFSPDGAGHSWAAMHTGGDKAILNGAADFFVRFEEVGVASGNSWFRPIDIGSSTAGGLRLILSSQTDSKLSLQILGEAGSLTTATNTSTSSRTINSNLVVAQGDVLHLGLTFATDPSGWVTMSLFGTSGVGQMDASSTSSALLGSIIFKINTGVVTSGLPSGSFNFSGGYLQYNTSTMDFDTFRLYDAAPATFGAIPEPGGLALTFGGLALASFMVWFRKP